MNFTKCLNTLKWFKNHGTFTNYKNVLKYDKNLSDDILGVIEYEDEYDVYQFKPVLYNGTSLYMRDINICK